MIGVFTISQTIYIALIINCTRIFIWSLTKREVRFFLASPAH